MFRAVASRVAKPRKLKKPTTSVTVVRIIEDDCAGSCPNVFRMIGITAPEKPAITTDIIIEMPITAASPDEEDQKYTITR